MSDKISFGAILQSAPGSNLLNRTVTLSSPLSENQNLVDQTVGSSLSEATKGSTLLAMLGAGAVSRLTRAGVMSLALGEGTLLPLMARGGSYAVALANESATFAGIERGFHSVPSGTEFHPSQTSFEKDWARAFINLGSLKLLGTAAEGQNLLLQHLLTDLGMVGGQQVGAEFGLVEKPKGNFAEQIVEAEALNWSQKGGMALLHGLSPNLLSMEKSLDLSLRSRESDLFSHRPLPFFSQLVPEEGEMFFTKSPESESQKGAGLFAMSQQEIEGLDHDPLSPNDLSSELIKTDFSDGSGHPGTDALYASLREMNQKSIPERIAFIPEGSRKIVRAGKTLYISPKALREIEKMDRFMADQDYVAEIFGFGVTHPFNQDTTVVTDFVRPREGKVALIGKGIFILEQEGQLAKALDYSETLKLTLKGGHLFLLSNEEQRSFPIDEIHWSWLKDDLQSLTDQELPNDWSQLKSKLEVGGEIPLETDWDLVVAGGQTSIKGAYLNRVFEEAQRQKAQVHYTMHHHPHLFARRLEESDMIERRRYYDALLAHSVGDVANHLAMGADWFEVRALGTEDDPSSQTETTSVVYGTSEIKQAMQDLGDIVDSIIHLPKPQATPTKLASLVEKLQMVVAHQKYADTLLQWIYRDSIEDFKKENPQDIKDPKDLILHTLFSSRNLSGALQKLIPSITLQHSEFPAHERLEISTRKYSSLENQNMEPPPPSLSVFSRSRDLFHFEGFGFLIFQKARGWLRNRGLLYCSRLTIFDPTTGMAVDSHLPVYYDDFDIFKSDLQRLFHRLRIKGMALERSEVNLIFGKVVNREDFIGRYPGEIIVQILKESGLRLKQVIPAEHFYDFNLETGEIIPAPEDE